VKGVVRVVDGMRITEGWGVKVAAAKVVPPAGAEAAIPSELDSITSDLIAQVIASGENSPIKIILKDVDIRIGKIIIRGRKEK